MEIREAITKEDYEKCLFIRMNVFVEEQQVPPELEVDEYEEDSRHFLLLKNNEPVGTARIRSKNGTTVKVERVAVMKDYRGHGYGHELMNHLHVIAKEHGYSHSFLGAQKHAVPFYESLGYEVSSDMYYDAGIEHFDMKKEL